MRKVDEAAIQKLVEHSRQKQREAGDEPFELSGREAGDVLGGVAHSTGKAHLQELMIRGHLRRVAQRPRHGTYMYRFIEDTSDLRVA